VVWAAHWRERAWAVEGAGGLGYLLAQRLVVAGERVLDIQPKLGARVRLLEAGNGSKSDPNDARPVAIAALRSKTAAEVAAAGHAAVRKVWSKRHRDLARARNQVVCRLHAVLCGLVPRGAWQGNHRRPGFGPPAAHQAIWRRGPGPARPRRRVR
jgi:transposase